MDTGNLKIITENPPIEICRRQYGGWEFNRATNTLTVGQLRKVLETLDQDKEIRMEIITEFGSGLKQVPIYSIEALDDYYYFCEGH